MTNELIVLLDNREVGRIYRDRKGKLSFVYDDAWRVDRGAYPISLSMPLTSAEHHHDKIDGFLWGLLPDNEAILDKWSQRFHVTARNAFGLIANVGEDCAGAIQLVRPERVEIVLGDSAPEIGWLEERDIAERLRLLTDDHAAWRIQRDTGQFSLAGAQPKTAFLFEKGRWGVPSGRVPTTHIFKPPIPDLDGHAENEHFCLELASRLGFLVPESTVMRFEDQIAIVIKRYDRFSTDAGLRRIHQEDMCQALGLPPTRKYEADGGPGAARIVTLLENFSISPLEDVEAFVDILGYNWLIGGSDGHAKNYSVLITTATALRLAPFYDLASALAYPALDPHKIKLAMKIGGSYRLRDIGRRNWERLALGLPFHGGALINRLIEFAKVLPDHISDTARQLHEQGLHHPVIDRLSEQLRKRADDCLRALNLASADLSAPTVAGEDPEKQ